MVRILQALFPFYVDGRQCTGGCCIIFFAWPFLFCFSVSPIQEKRTSTKEEYRHPTEYCHWLALTADLENSVDSGSIKKVQVRATFVSRRTSLPENLWNNLLFCPSMVANFNPVLQASRIILKLGLWSSRSSGEVWKLRVCACQPADKRKLISFLAEMLFKSTFAELSLFLCACCLKYLDGPSINFSIFNLPINFEINGSDDRLKN